MTETTVSGRPLAVDLDGTLLKCDLLQEGLLKLAIRRPFACLNALWTGRRGKAALKQAVATMSPIEAEHLPYNQPFLEWLKQERQHREQIWLVSGSDQQWVKQVAQHVGLFDRMIASDGQTNLTGRHKAAKLSEELGSHQFDYAGNAKVDVAVWQQAAGAFVVNASAGTTAQARAVTTLVAEFPTTRSRTAWLRCIRIHQWLKNGLVFIPALASHRILDWAVIVPTLLLFFAFSTCASAVYLFNDIADLDADRRHIRKRFRPFAAGELPVSHGVVVAFMLFVCSMSIAICINWLSLGAILLYIIATFSYTSYFKHRLILDVFVLCGLYLLRIVAGGVANSIGISSWLFAFSGFSVLSISFAKRFAELHHLQHKTGLSRQTRKYFAEDLMIVCIFGICSGFAAMLILSLYITSPTTATMYRSPMILWIWIPAMMYWFCRIWIITYRGAMNEDPVSFVIRDKVTYLVAVTCVVVLAVASTVTIDGYGIFLK